MAYPSYRLHYLVRTNLIGFDYLPEYWQSYYEVTEGVPGMARCSGHWNHHTLRHELALDLHGPKDVLPRRGLGCSARPRQ